MPEIIDQEEFDWRLEQHQEWLASAGAEGRRLKLVDCHLEKVNADDGADLQMAVFKDCLLVKCDFSGASLVGSQWLGVEALGCYLSEVNLTGSLFAWGSISESDLRGSCFSGATFGDHSRAPSLISSMTITFCQMDGADFTEIDTGSREGYLRLADIAAGSRGINVEGANLSGVKFTGDIPLMHGASTSF